jgi:phosphoribosyl 1,2-cyclic phosphate phosphodiesterase
MKITFLGTGTSTGNPQILCECKTCKSEDPKDIRLRSSVFVETDDASILIDCGPDFRYQSLRSGIKKIDSVILTHEHYDHVGGLDDLRPFCKVRDLPLYSLCRVLKKIQEYMPYSFTKNPYSGVPVFELNEVDNQVFKINNTSLIPIKLMHYKLEVLGVRIGDFAYLTDFNYINNHELGKLHGLKVLVIDALRKEKHISHNSLYESLGIIDLIKPEKTLLIHMSHDMGLHKEVNDELPENISLSWDNLEISIK